MNFIKTDSLPLFLITISILLAFLGENTTQYFIYDRNAIASGELWRLFSGHLTHISLTHLWLNLAALALIWVLVKNFLSTYFWWISAFMSSLGISIFLYIFMSELQWYVGLSGLLHSLLVCGAVVGVAKGRKEFILLLVLIFLKILYEQFYGSFSMEIIDGNIVVNAHLYGAVMGVICATIFIKFRRIDSHIDS